ncbi:MAG: DUF4386 domain-containing protein [Phycisphaerae bacterium]|nr:DUF4386 domain-containing protein [Phycisphaerae bacterium]
MPLPSRVRANGDEPRDESERIPNSPMHGRLAGLVGVAMLASGIFAGHVGSRLIVRGDAAATSGNIVGNETLFRLGITGSLIMMIAYLIYALLLYQLLKQAGRGLAMAMLGFVVAAVPVYVLNQLSLFAVLPLASERRYEQVRLFLELHKAGNLLAAIFFGLWLFPLGLLVLRSSNFPRVLGVLLLCGTPGYLVLFVQAFVYPGSDRTLWTSPLLVVTHVSELALLLWLLVKGGAATSR